MYFFFFFFNDTATTEIYTLSLHDALPIYPHARLLAVLAGGPLPARQEPAELRQAAAARLSRRPEAGRPVGRRPAAPAAASGGGPGDERAVPRGVPPDHGDRKSTRLNSSHRQ